MKTKNICPAETKDSPQSCGLFGFWFWFWSFPRKTKMPSHFGDIELAVFVLFVFPQESNKISFQYTASVFNLEC